MVGEAELSLDYGLALLAHVDSLMELVRIFIKEEEGEAGNKLLLASTEYSDLELLILIVKVEDHDGSPDIILVLIDGRQGVRLVRPSLTEVDPFRNGLLFLPSIVSCQSFHAWQVRATVKDLILLLEDLKSLLCSLVLVGGSLDLFKEGLLADDIFVLFNNICMSCRQALTF